MDDRPKGLTGPARLITMGDRADARQAASPEGVGETFMIQVWSSNRLEWLADRLVDQLSAGWRRGTEPGCSRGRRSWCRTFRLPPI